MYDPTSGILSGMSEADLRAALSSLQTALIQLSSGAKVASASYSQGDGSQSVTYTQAQVPQLMALIQSIQAQLGISRGRRPIRFRFR